MFFPLRTDIPLAGTPWMNWLLIALNLLVFAAQRALPPGWESAYMLSPDLPRLPNFITYAFLHAGLGHIIGNMLFLYIFGNNVCDRMGNLGYLAFYLAGGVFAGIGYVLTQNGLSPVLGASGAVAAVTGAYLCLFPRSSITVVYFFFLVGSFEVSSMFFVLFFFLKDLFFSFTGGQGVAHTAHLGGSIFGFTVCFSLLAVSLLPRNQYDIVSLYDRWKRRREYRQLVRKGYDPFGGVPGPPGPAVKQGPIDPAMQKILDLRARLSEALSSHDLAGAADMYLELKRLDPAQVLSRPNQLDIANFFFGEQRYPEAAEAYEQFVRCYGNHEQLGHVQLMLGLIYGRYLNEPARAREALKTAVDRLRSERELTMARAELERLGAVPG